MFAVLLPSASMSGDGILSGLCPIEPPRPDGLMIEQFHILVCQAEPRSSENTGLPTYWCTAHWR